VDSPQGVGNARLSARLMKEKTIIDASKDRVNVLAGFYVSFLAGHAKGKANTIPKNSVTIFPLTGNVQSTLIAIEF